LFDNPFAAKCKDEKKIVNSYVYEQPRDCCSIYTRYDVVVTRVELSNLIFYCV